jgi:hypothetical protein
MVKLSRAYDPSTSHHQSKPRSPAYRAFDLRSILADFSRSNYLFTFEPAEVWFPLIVFLRFHKTLSQLTHSFVSKSIATLSVLNSASFFVLEWFIRIRNLFFCFTISSSTLCRIQRSRLSLSIRSNTCGY